MVWCQLRSDHFLNFATWGPCNFLTHWKYEPDHLLDPYRATSSWGPYEAGAKRKAYTNRAGGNRLSWEGTGIVNIKKSRTSDAKFNQKTSSSEKRRGKYGIGSWFLSSRSALGQAQLPRIEISVLFRTFLPFRPFSELFVLFPNFPPSKLFF